MRLVIVSAVVLSLAAGARAQTYDEKLWLGAAATAGLGPRVRLEVEQELRVGSDSGYDQTHTQLGLRWSPVAPLRVGAFYRLALRDGETRHRVGADGEGLLRLGRLRLGYRLRFQATTRPGNDTQLVVRNRARAVVRASRRARPFVAIELHHQLSPVAEHREFRFYAGLDWQLTRSLDLTAFYLRQEEDNVGNPEHNNVIGVAVTYAFGDLRGREQGAPPGE